MPFRPLMLCVVALFVGAGCQADKGGNPAMPAGPDALNARPMEGASVSSNRHLWGIWDVTIDPATQSVEVTPQRGAEMHLNALRLLEVAPCNDCLTFGNLHIVGPEELEVDVTLTHPYPGLLKYTGFDVRGILVSQADYIFPASGRKVAWGEGVPRMLNPDGYTPLFNPTEYPPTKPAALGYIPGKMATGGDLSATLNPFLAYRRDAPRRMFEAGGSEVRTVRLYAPPGPMHFGYAVDACWQSVENVVDPLKDFPPDANCLEAYEINVSFPYDLESSWMSQNPVNVEVFDHQGIGTISAVTIEAPDIFAGEVALTLSTQMGEESWLFSGFITNEAEAVHGTYPYLVKVTDTEWDQNLGAIQAWAVGSARVKEGWARTWGGDGSEKSLSVATDASGNVYVAGYFHNTVDFDPGSGVDNHTSNGEPDAFLCKFDSSGNFIWARTWGGALLDPAYSVAIDHSGNACVAGFFMDAVDFDPGSGVDIHTANGDWDAFLSKFDPSGNFLWARTWGGGPGIAYAQSVAIDVSNNAYVAGDFSDTVDFDPGSGVDNHMSKNYEDACLSKFDSSGNFLWAQTWGGYYNDSAASVTTDASGYAYTAGSFYDTVDFDPGSGVDSHASNGMWDAFLGKFDSSGNFLWARTWGGYTYDEAYSVAVDTSGNPYVAGLFEGTVDLDPGSGVDNHASSGYSGDSLSEFDTNGDFVWARTWGGGDDNNAGSVAIDASGHAYVAGFFSGAVDFDPGSGVDNHTSNGYDAFLSKFDSSGGFLWVRTWGGDYDDHAASVATDASGNAYAGGFFYDAADFDPGSGVDDHTANGGSNDAFLVKFLPDGNW